MNNLVIRKYNENDFKAVINLLKENFNICDNINSLKDTNDSFGIIASINENIVAYLRVDKLYDPFKKKNYYFLNYVCVNNNYQNMNIGSNLLKYVFKLAKDNNISYIELTSKPTREAANHLYLKEGFTIRNTNVFRKIIEN